MTRYKIVLVPFPFDDLSSTKVRPALCLTEPMGKYRHVVLAFITSKVPAKPEESDLIIMSDSDGFEKSGLRVSSTLKLHRMMTATTSLIRRELGKLSESQQEMVKKKLKKLFDLE